MLSLYIFKFHDIIIMFYVFYIIQYDIFNHLGGIVKKKILAFTLAETLIVMGVIGVVAALTLPNLNSSTNNKEKVAKVKKIYQNLNDAFGRATAVYGPYSEWPFNRKSERITEFMKLAKDCTIPSVSGCTNNSNFKFITGENVGETLGMQGDSYVLADGTTLVINGGDYIMIDIDGQTKGANTLGKDIFEFDMDSTNGIVAVGDLSNCFRKGNCTKWVIMNDNMDYLNADSNGKCKNSNVTLSETVISCK